MKSSPMSILTNTAGNDNALAKLAGTAPNNVVSAVRQASSKTGIDFSYLLQQAKAESSFDTTAKASTSSACGLYQFIDSTWLQMVKDHGCKYGLSEEAEKLQNTANLTSEEKGAILKLRENPEISSLMAAEFAAGNKKCLENNWGGEIGSTELYFAHFMGAGGATEFLNAKDENPLAYAADLFPKEATANKNVFFDNQTGKPRTLAGVYDFFDKKFSIEENQNCKITPEQQNPEQNYFSETSNLLNNNYNLPCSSSNFNLSTLAPYENLLSVQNLLFISALDYGNII